MTRASRDALLPVMAALVVALHAEAQPVDPPQLTPREAPGSTADSDPMLPLPGQPASPEVLASTRDALIRANDLAGALALAKGLIEELAPDDPALAPQLLVLAHIQSELDQHDDAEASYLRALDLIKQRDGESSMSLVRPYQALGRAYIKSQRYGDAVTSLDEARQITQRNLGLFNLEQIGLLDDLTLAYLGSGDTSEAQRTQEARLETAIRHFGADDEHVVPFHYELANYYDRSRMRQHAREQYEAVLAIERGESSAPRADLARPLRELVEIDLLTGENSGARQQLAELVASAVDLAPRQRARALMALGDWEMVHNSISGGLDYYRRAAAAFQADPETRDERFMAEPALIDFVPPLSPVDRRTRKHAYSWGTIVLDFDVSAQAGISDVHVVSAEPAGLMEDAYVRRLLQTHARPRLEDGVPVATSDVELKHYFRYYVED